MTHRLSKPCVVLLVVALVPVLASCQPAGERAMEEAAIDTAAIMSATDSLRMAYEEAYNAGDTAALRSTLSRDVVFLPAQGPPIKGRKKVLSVLGRGMAMNQQISINPQGVKLLGSDAIVDYGTATFTVMPPDADTTQTTHRHGYLVVAERMADAWKLTRAANTRLQPPASSKGSDGGR